MENQPTIKEIKVAIQNEFVLNLVAYLVRAENFVFVGNEQEIWLENLSHPRVQLIHINDQLTFTSERALYISQKAQIIASQIKRKFLMPKVNFLVLNTYFVNNEDVTVEKNEAHVLTVNLIDAASVAQSETIHKLFPNIKNVDLTVNMAEIVSELQTETRKQATREMAFASLAPKPLITYIFLAIITVFFGFLWFRAREIPAWFVGLYYGSAYTPLVLAGDYWRLLTANIIHLEPLHFIFNAIIIYRFGTMVETVIGRWRMVFIIIISAIITSLFHIASSPVTGFGASGVAFGIMGVLVFLGFEMRKTFMPLLRQVLFPMLIMNIFMSLVLPNVSFWGHVGGFIGGFLAIAIVGVKGVQPFWARSILTTMTLVILVGGLWIGALRMNENHNFNEFNRVIIHNYRVMGNHQRADRLTQILFPGRR